MYPDLQVDSTFENETAKLRDDQFALIGYDEEGNKHRRYPIHNEESIKRANFDFACFRSRLSPREKKVAAHFIKEASITRRIPIDPMVDLAAVDGIETNNVGRFDDYVEPVQKQAAIAPKVTALNGRYPLDTPEMVQHACSYLEKHASEFSTADRRTFATNTQRQADILGVKTTSVVQKYASQTFGDHLNFQLRLRAGLRPEARGDYEKLAEYVGVIGVDDFSALLDELDRKNSLQRAWGRNIKDPLDSTLGIPKEAASGWSVTLGGKTYTEQDLQRACESEEVRDLFGDEYAEQFKQTMVFDSLPTETKQIVLTYA